MRRLLFAAGAAAALMFAAACGDDAGDDGEVASAGGEAEESESAEEVDQEEALLEFSACMRENGVEEFPDLDGGGGGIMIGGDDDVTADPDFEPAMEACQDLLEDIRGGSTGADGPGIDEETAREFADCMRENGVEEFPDPTDDGMAIDRDMLDDPDFEAASEACSEIHEFGLGGDD